MKLEMLRLKKLKEKRLLWNVLPLYPNSNLSDFEKLFNYDINTHPIWFLTMNRISTNIDRKLTKSINTLAFHENSDLMFVKYNLYRQSYFIKFFEFLDIDVPSCFKNIKSLRRHSLEQPLFKLSNYLMKNGKKEKTFPIIVNSLFRIFNHIKTTTLYQQHSFTSNWMRLFFIFNGVYRKFKSFKTVDTKVSFNIINDNFISQNIFYSYSKNLFKKSTFLALMFFLPLFKFDVYNIDKNVKKFSRKKTSKYVFVWKYIPVYKRKIMLLRLLSKNIKFHSEKSFKLQLSESFFDYCSNHDNSLVGKLNVFTHNYVFKNFRKSLANTYKTTI